MTLTEKIKQEATEAMRNRDTVRLSVLRGVLSAFTNELVAKGKKPRDTLSDDDAAAVIKRLVKQRKDSIEQYEKGGRTDLAREEAAELAILKSFLPQEAAPEVIQEIAIRKKQELGIDDPNKSGILVGAVMKELKGSADGATVKQIVEGILN